MKAKKFFKSLLSLALAVILTASLCVCGLSVSATDGITTVNVFDGTIAATYTGGSDGMLKASAGITGILEDKAVACLSPQYAFDSYRRIALGFNALEESAINYDDAQALSIYIKNDLGTSIKWRLSEYQEVDEWHHYSLPTGTVYWMVNTAENSTKKYTYTTHKYIYIPEDFEGYIVYDLTTCDPEELANFLCSDFYNMYFYMSGFTEKTVGNAFYYGDMNITTASADQIVYEKTPDDTTAVYEYFGTNPLTDGMPYWRNHIMVSSSEGEYIGQTFTFSNPQTYPACAAKLFTANELSYGYKAIVFRFKFAPGVTKPSVFTISTSEKAAFQDGYVKGNWTTVNLINNKIQTYSNTNLHDITLSGEGFEGYFILNVDDTLTINANGVGNLGYSDFLDKYLGKDIYMFFGLWKGSKNFTDGVCNFELGEISALDEDSQKFIYANTENNDVIFDPATDTFRTKTSNLTAELVETETIGSAYKFTNSGGEAKFYTKYTKINDYFDNYEAIVFKVRTTNGYTPQFIINGDYNYINTKYITVNTLTGVVNRSSTKANSAGTLTDEVFEGYIIAPMDSEAKIRIGDKTPLSWAEAMNTFAGTGLSIGVRIWSSGGERFNGWQFGEISLVKDLDAFLEEVAPDIKNNDPNENVIFNPTTDKFYSTGDNLTATVTKTDNIGNVYSFAYDTTSTTESLAVTKNTTVNDSFKSYEAIVFEFKTTNKNVPSLCLNDNWNYIKTKYITINTLTGAVNKADTVKESANGLITDEVFEGYIIAPINSEASFRAVRNGEFLSWADAIDVWAANSNSGFKAMLYQTAYYSTNFNSWQLGEISFVSDLDAYIKKITSPSTVKGDANLDGESDVRDLVCMKKAIAGTENVKINAFNVKLEGIGKALDGTDLTSVRKQLLGISSVTNDVGMLAWGLLDITDWNAVYGTDYGEASDIFNYGISSGIDTVKTNAENGAASWMKIGNPFKDADNPTVMSTTYIKNLENKISGMKLVGAWDSIVGFYTEEIRGSMTDEQYKILTKYLSDTYPGKRILAILSVDEVKGTDTVTAANYDTYQYTTDIGYDIYSTIDATVYEELNNTLNTNLEGLNYKKWYFPRTYIEGDTSLEQNTEQFMISHLELLYELLLEEENKGGLWLYTWDSYSGGTVGLSELVSKYGYTELVETIVNIGAEIKAMN